jgi:uncharacterized protein (DUF924 family)
VTAPQDVLDFWFAGDPTCCRPAWFRRDDAFDAACARFGATLAKARQGTLQDGTLQDGTLQDGTLQDWATSADGALALVVVLDQFSRNLHRNSPEAFATDPQARAVARDAIARGLDRALHPVQRIFLYLPFEHSEALADQDLSVALFEPLRLALGDSTVEHAYRHRDIIRRFGRFPHRNAVLGRASTPAEQRALAQPGAGF